MRRLLCVAFALAVLAAPPALADPPKTSLKDIENEVMCQVCGTPLALSPDAPEAQRERAYILTLIAQGKTEPEIKHALVEQYGPSVLAVPRDRGFGLAAYLVPGAAIVVACGAVAAVALRWRRAKQDAEMANPRPPVLNEAASKRLDEDLERHDP